MALHDGTYRWTRHSHDAASNVTRSQVTLTDYPAGSVLTGHIDGVTHDAAWRWSVVGWACGTGSSSSVAVQSFSQTGQLLASGRADLGSEEAIGHACQSGGSAHRFALPISLAQRQHMAGQRISVHALSPQGAQHNAVLTGSNTHTIPAAPVTGNIHGVTRDGEWNYFVEGWACSLGVDAPIDVHVYAGGPADGGGALIASARADGASGTDVASACQAHGSAYSFKVHLTESVRNAHSNRGIHVHAISPVGGPHLTIGNSGAFPVPPLLRTADFISFTPSPGRIDNGEHSQLTAHLRNTGNVVWRGDSYLAWGSGSFTHSEALPHSVYPGQDVAVRWHVAPLNRGSGITRVMYMASMAQGGHAWGPRGNTGIDVENPRPYCPPGSPVCNVPWNVDAAGKDASTTEKGAP